MIAGCSGNDPSSMLRPAVRFVGPRASAELFAGCDGVATMGVLSGDAWEVVVGIVSGDEAAIAELVGPLLAGDEVLVAAAVKENASSRGTRPICRAITKYWRQNKRGIKIEIHGRRIFSPAPQNYTPCPSKKKGTKRKQGIGRSQPGEAKTTDSSE